MDANSKPNKPNHQSDTPNNQDNKQTIHNEEPHSLTLDMQTSKGVGILLCLRGHSVSDLIEKAKVVEGMMDKLGWSAKPPRYKSAWGNRSAGSGGQNPPQQGTANGDGESKQCTIHNVSMKRFDREGRTWYSHKTHDGQWCKGQ